MPTRFYLMFVLIKPKLMNVARRFSKTRGGEPPFRTVPGKNGVSLRFLQLIVDLFDFLLQFLNLLIKNDCNANYQPRQKNQSDVKGIEEALFRPAADERLEQDIS